jgi:hypothetical protein
LFGVPEYDKLDVLNRLGVPIKEAGDDDDWCGVPLAPEVPLADSTNDIFWYGTFSLFRMSFKISCLKKKEHMISTNYFFLQYFTTQ